MRLARHLPNLVTVLRLACVPATIWLIMRGDMAAAFWLFIGAGASDAVDGILARLLQAHSVLGSYLDALADKVLLVSVFLSLGWLGLLWGWLVALVVGRDVLLVVGAVALYWSGARQRVMPFRISKINTFAQILLAMVVLGNQGMTLFPAAAVPALSWLVAITTTASACAYFVAWRRRMASPIASGKGD